MQTSLPPQPAEYRCPGEDYGISRAVHLGRLSSFYPGCRRCSHRDDTGTLSPKQIRLLLESRPRAERPPLFHQEGAAGIYENDLGPTAARNMAAAMGIWLRRRADAWVPLRRSSAGMAPTRLVPSSGTQAAENRSPVVAIAGDGRPLTADLVAAMSEGLRWTGCDVVDIGPATAACLASAIDHLRASGGVLLGNPGCEPQYVGLTFWDGGPRPLSAGGPLELLREIYDAGCDRPTRSYGALRRFQADAIYLAGLAPRYHALRPLRLVLHSACGPLLVYLRKLTEDSACQVIPCRTARDSLAEQVRAEGAHFAAQIEGDGETCRLLDEQGRPVPAERLLLLLARHLLAETQKGVGCLLPERPTGCFAQQTPDPFLPESPQAAVVLEKGFPSATAQRIEAAGARVILSQASRRAMAEAMQAHGALLGGGSDGRFWYAASGPLSHRELFPGQTPTDCVGGAGLRRQAASGRESSQEPSSSAAENPATPLPDALMTLTLLLGILSQSDRPFSAVLDKIALPC